MKKFRCVNEMRCQCNDGDLFVENEQFWIAEYLEGYLDKPVSALYIQFDYSTGEFSEIFNLCDEPVFNSRKDDELETIKLYQTVVTKTDLTKMNEETEYLRSLIKKEFFKKGMLSKKISKAFSTIQSLPFFNLLYKKDFRRNVCQLCSYDIDFQYDICDCSESLFMGIKDDYCGSDSDFSNCEFHCLRKIIIGGFFEILGFLSKEEIDNAVAEIVFCFQKRNQFMDDSIIKSQLIALNKEFRISLSLSKQEG